MDIYFSKSRYTRKIKKTKGKDKEVVRVVEKIKKAGIKTLKEDKWKIDSKVVLKEEKAYVSKNNTLRLEVI